MAIPYTLEDASVVRGVLVALFAALLCSACCHCEPDRVEAAAKAPEPDALRGCTSSPEPKPGSDEVLFRIDCASAELPALVRAIAKVTRKNYLFDDRLQGTVTVISDKAVTAEEASTLLRAVLKVRRYSIVDDGDGILQIVPSPKEPKEGSSPS